MRIAIYFAVHRRLDILKTFLKGLERLQQDHEDIEFIPFAVYSSDDEGEILKGVRSLKHDNEYLGRKKNAGLRELLKLDWDYMIEVGSDDLLSSDLIDFYRPYFDQGVKVFGIRECYFVEMSTGKVAHWVHDYAIGAGRCFKRSVFDDLGGCWRVRYLRGLTGDNYCISSGTIENMPIYKAKRFIDGGLCELVDDVSKPFDMWTDTRQEALDGDSEFRLGMNGVNVKVLEVDRPMVVDMKTEENLHRFSDFKESDISIEWLIDNGFRELR